MTAVEERVALDSDKLMGFVFRAVDEIGATLNTALVVMGDRLGLYRALAGAGPADTRRARRAHRHRRAVRPRVAERAGGRRVRRVRPRHRPLRVPAEQAVALTDEIEPRLPARLLPDRARLRARLPQDRRGGHDRRRLRLARARPRRARRLRAVLPARLQREPRRGVAPRARRRGREARARRDGGRRRLRPRRLDDADGPGVPGVDVRRLRLPRGVDRTRRASGPRKRASATGCASRWRRPQSFSGRGYDLVTMFDCLHDMGDPVGAARHVRESLAPDGTWMIVEPAPATGSRTTSTRSDGPTTASRRCCARRPRCPRMSGWRWARRPARRESATWSRAGGFTRFRRVAETPFNFVFEARPVSTCRRERALRSHRGQACVPVGVGGNVTQVAGR